MTTDATIRMIEAQRDIATTITEQATTGALMTLGAYPLRPTNLYADDTRRGGAMWNVRIMPMKKNGDRSSTVRKMELTIELTYADTYTVTAKYYNRGKAVIHFQRDNVYWDQLEKLLVALDWDGDEILNPRYAIND